MRVANVVGAGSLAFFFECDCLVRFEIDFEACRYGYRDNLLQFARDLFLKVIQKECIHLRISV